MVMRYMSILSQLSFNNFYHVGMSCMLRSGHYGGGSDVIARYDGYIAQQLHQKKRWRRSII